MSAKPISLFIITYNHERFIDSCLRSVYGQVKPDQYLNVFIIDDCSTDGTTGVVRNFIRSHGLDWVLKVNESNQFSKGVNHILPILRECSSEYVAILEGDDFWGCDHKIDTQYKFLELNRSYSCVGHRYQSVDVNGSPLGDGFPVHPLNKRRNFSAPELLYGVGFFHLSTLLFRNPSTFPSEMTRAYNFDNFLNSYLGLFGGGAYIADLPPSNYRIHEQGIWTSLDRRDRMSENAISWLLMARYFKRIKRDDVANHFMLMASRFVVELGGNRPLG